MSQIVDIPLGAGADIKVSEANDTLTVTLDATVLGTPQTMQMNFSLVTLITMIANGIANPILAMGFKALAALL